MVRLTSLALITVAAGGTFLLRLLGNTTEGPSWWVEGGLGFLVVASLVGLWVRSVNQNTNDRIAHSIAIAEMNKAHAEAMANERAYHRTIIDEIAKEKAAATAALMTELKDQSEEQKLRIDELERLNKGRHNEGRKP